jgi:hypothetical protein
MVSVIMLVVIGLCIGWIVWMRRRRWHAYATPASPGAIPRENLALEAFMHGNSCLRDEQFADASTAFHQARELDPKLPYVAARLAEVKIPAASCGAFRNGHQTNSTARSEGFSGTGYTGE